MTLFDRLVAENGADWNAYTRHAFVRGLGEGSLPEPAFKHYLVQDYLFLIQFARAYALAILKARTLDEMRAGLRGVSAILDMEMDLHVAYCQSWGIDRDAMAATPEAMETTAYTRFVIDTGLQGDLLDLHVALAPCVIGYAVIARELSGLPTAGAPDNPYRQWIAEYASAPYQELAAAAIRTLDDLGGEDVTDVRFRRLSAIFGQASRLEAAFWQMGLNAAG